MRMDPPKPGEDWFRIENKAGENVTHVYIYDEIGYWGTTASDFAKELAVIDTADIHFHINSPGGEVFDGVAIYNAILNHKSNTTAYVDALAASAASFIATSADKLIMAKNATMMIHDAIGFSYGNAADMAEMKVMLDRISNTIAEMYQTKGGGEVSDWRALMKAETWYSAQEAVDSGLADEVAAKEDKTTEPATNQWDLSLFKYQNRTNAPSPLMQRMLIGNHTEASMADKPGTEEGQTSSTDTGTAPSEEEAARSTGTSTEVGTEAQTVQTGTEQASTQPAPPANTAGVLINGVRTTDWTAVQAQLDAANQFRQETVDQSRKDFVTSLARSNKVAATQIDSLQNFALTLSDEQYTAWSNTFGAALANPLFDQHGQTPADGGRPNDGTTSNSADRIMVLEAIVADHRRTGMDEEKLKNKGSYLELQALKNAAAK